MGRHEHIQVDWTGSEWTSLNLTVMSRNLDIDPTFPSFSKNIETDIDLSLVCCFSIHQQRKLPVDWVQQGSTDTLARVRLQYPILKSKQNEEYTECKW